ncbi:5-(carboxyamino)imidazole ribonucleotide synthase [Desertibacillus haloalkaliphilus]|uniref:5-(carboxyamino)imidazole ribonucleotide synthase n=1 Tax=Desertibacillus haloalkaliphilus TaxID=1328930 RepID=UPI001C253942|nr:5-(carboxyamino)imidazole ribonucleotide synthase [Desertibacillus haloalkaliphilus]MBU8906385.1 5-(carboxyamino)imidazole ribonucleotide synthase [Desertibacillus haloalkaliphilus]
MNKLIKPGDTLGILGGGQLGRMMAIAAKEMGYKIAVLEPKADSPCGQVADVEVIANYDDLNGAKQLAEQCQLLTYEFENINADTAAWLENNLYLPQGSQLLSVTQDRGREKRAIESFAIQVAPYRLIESFADLIAAIDEIGTPSVLKTCRGGYDGKGQVVIKEQADIEQAYQTLENKGQLVLEQWIPFEKELSVIVSRSVSGEVKTFPVAENIHRDNILHQSIVPARISAHVEQKAEEIAKKLAQSFEMVGTLAVEMFLTKSGDIYVNELAPRPHNSGHYTIDACETSQFQQHIRAVCDWPLGETNLLKPVVMVNILGEHVDAVIDKIPEFSDVKLHLYGKEEAKSKRKMGHVNILADHVDEALEKAEALNIW